MPVRAVVRQCTDLRSSPGTYSRSAWKETSEEERFCVAIPSMSRRKPIVRVSRGTTRGWTNNSLTSESTFLRLTAASGSVMADRTGPSRITPRRRAGIEKGSSCTWPGPSGGTRKEATSPFTGNSRVAEPDDLPGSERTCTFPLASSPTWTLGRCNSNSTSCSRLPSTDSTATTITTAHITDRARNSSQPSHQPGIPVTTIPMSRAQPSAVTDATGREREMRRRTRGRPGLRETVAVATGSGTDLTQAFIRLVGASTDASTRAITSVGRTPANSASGDMISRCVHTGAASSFTSSGRT